MSEIQKLARKVQVYDNPATFDRYTVIITRERHTIDVYGMSKNATQPDGFNQYSHTITMLQELPKLGERVSLLDLPAEVLQAIKDRVN